MKVSITLPDSLIEQVKAESGEVSVTESLYIALNEWLDRRRIRRLNMVIKEKPMVFRSGYSADVVRQNSRGTRVL